MHHVGFVVNGIKGAVNSWVRSLNGSWDGEIFHDPIQRVNVTFLSTPGSDVQIELVEPAGPQSPVQSFLGQGGGLHHLCYEVEDCDEMLKAVRQRGGALVRRPKPAVAFAGRRIAWALTAEKLLLEFLEKTLK